MEGQGDKAKSTTCMGKVVWQGVALVALLGDVKLVRGCREALRIHLEASL